MDTYERIESEMKDAMRQKDSLKLSVLRMAIAAFRNTEILKKVKKIGRASCRERVFRAV